MGPATDSILDALREAFTDIPDICEHPGEFTEDELRRFGVGKTALRFAILEISGFQMGGSGGRLQQATMSLTVIATDRCDNTRARRALDLVSSVVDWLTFNRFDKPALLPVDPKTISARNLYSGQIDSKTGIALWGVTWTQRLKTQETR